MNVKELYLDKLRSKKDQLGLIYSVIRGKNVAKVLDVLSQQDDYINVTEIYIKSRMRQDVVSQGLNLLKRAKIVTKRKEGKTALYKINTRNLRKLNQIADVLELLR